MNGDNTVDPTSEFKIHIIFWPGADVAHIWVDPVPRTVQHRLIGHVFGDRVQKRCVHNFHRQHDLVLLCLRRAVTQPIAEQPHRLRRGWLIIHIVPRQLDHTHAKVCRQTNGLIDDRIGLAAEHRVAAAEREAPVCTEAHRLQSDPCVAAGLPQFPALLRRPIQSGKPGVGLVDADFHIVKAKRLGFLQSGFPAVRWIQCFFIKSQKVISEHADRSPCISQLSGRLPYMAKPSSS